MNLGRPANALEDRNAIQKDPDKLESWARANMVQEAISPPILFLWVLGGAREKEGSPSLEVLGIDCNQGWEF